MMVATTRTATAERILDVATALVQQHGYNGFSYDDIATAIGIRKPSIHHHFRTKSDLVAAMIDRYLHVFSGKLLAISTSQDHAIARLEAYIGLFQQTYAQDQRLCLCAMLSATPSTLAEPLRFAVARFFEINLHWLEETIRLGQRVGQLRNIPDARAQAQLLLATLEGAMILGRGTARADSLLDCSAALIAMLKN